MRLTYNFNALLPKLRGQNNRRINCVSHVIPAPTFLSCKNILTHKLAFVNAAIMDKKTTLKNMQNQQISGGAERQMAFRGALCFFEKEYTTNVRYC